MNGQARHTKCKAVNLSTTLLKRSCSRSDVSCLGLDLRIVRGKEKKIGRGELLRSVGKTPKIAYQCIACLYIYNACSNGT